MGDGAVRTNATVIGGDSSADLSPIPALSRNVEAHEHLGSQEHHRLLDLGNDCILYCSPVGHWARELSAIHLHAGHGPAHRPLRRGSSQPAKLP